MTIRSKKSGEELLVDVLRIFAASDRLVERQVDLERLVGLAFANLGHGLAEGLEVVGARLVDEDVAVGEEQDAFLDLGFPQAIDDLEGGIGFPVPVAITSRIRDCPRATASTVRLTAVTW